MHVNEIVLQHEAREQSPEFIADRFARALVAPFARRIGDWRSKVAFLQAKHSSRYMTRTEAGPLVSEARALAEEIRRQHVEFMQVSKGAPPHGRITDLDAAYRQLMKELKAILASH